MADTLERALPSVASQLDDDFEVLVVDDGSTDGSVSVLEKLAMEFPLIRYIPLSRDRKRKLGETRNISVREAKGEYVILHVDADDVWEPFIKDFVSVFHRLESCMRRDILLSGQQINIGKRDFLLEHGPYRNTGRLEDRDLWTRLAAIDSYIPLDHRVFRTRLSRPQKLVFWKAVRSLWDRLLYDFRSGTDGTAYIVENLQGVVVSRSEPSSLKNRLFRAFFVVPAYLASKFQEDLTPPEAMTSANAFADYRERTRGTYSEIMSRNGCDPSLAFLSAEAQSVFQ